jgi:hypothetical protein
MVDLLNNKKQLNKNAELNVKPVEKNKVDISKYKDPEGLNIAELELGLWFLKHRLFFVYLFYGLLILISLITWPIFIWNFGNYIFVGMKEDAASVAQFSNNDTSQLLAAMRSQRPKELQWQNPQVLKLEDGKTSFIVKVFNPNPDYMVKFSYFFSTGDNKTGVWNNFLYPSESKYIVAIGTDLKLGSRLPILNITNPDWDRISGHIYDDWPKFLSSHFNVSFIDEKFIPGSQSLISNKESISQINFTAKNESAYSFKNIAFTILLKQGQATVGAERWVAENFLSGKEYSYNLSILGSYNNVSNLEIYPEIDVTNKENYLYIGSGPAEPK